MATVKVTLCLGVMRASNSFRDGELGAKCDNKAQQRSCQPGPCPTVTEWANRASLGTTDGFNQESRSPDKFVVMKQA